MRRIALALVPILALAGRSESASAQNRRIQGFADVSYVATERDIADGFDLGQLVGHAAIGLTDRVTVFAEVSLTGRPSGYEIEAERLILRYDFADYFKLSAGRYHTPISYWNTAFHHGMWLQTSVARPEYVRFGSRFIPVHFVGLLAEGSFPSLAWSPGYYAGFGNGRADDIARAGDAGDVNDRRAWLGGVFVRPAQPYGLEAGAAWYRDRLGDGAHINETIYSAYAVWTKESPEVIAEYARVVHDRVDGLGESVGNDAYYAQLAYRLSGRFNDLKPYARIERIDSPVLDPTFGPLALEYEAAIAGIRIDVATQAALKLEYRNERFGSGERANSIYVQVSFAFPGPAASSERMLGGSEQREIEVHE